MAPLEALMTQFVVFPKIRNVFSCVAYWRDSYRQRVLDAEQRCGPFVILDGSVWIPDYRITDREMPHMGSAAAEHFLTDRIS